jgi:GH25 family lysozyme M1 (1,4-beta-N-acetylmuramidase)
MIIWNGKYGRAYNDAEIVCLKFLFWQFSDDTEKNREKSRS